VCVGVCVSVNVRVSVNVCVQGGVVAHAGCLAHRHTAVGSIAQDTWREVAVLCDAVPFFFLLFSFCFRCGVLMQDSV
jgi:hypothetical protein